MTDLLLQVGYFVSMLDSYSERFREPNPRTRYFIGDISNHKLPEEAPRRNTHCHSFAFVRGAFHGSGKGVV